MMIRINQVKLIPASVKFVEDYWNTGLAEINWDDIMKRPLNYHLFKMVHGRYPLALIAVSRKPEQGYLYLDRLEKLPQAESMPGIGVLAILKLIKLSRLRGMLGKVMLDASVTAKPFYQRIGMQEIAPRRFIFTPAEASRYQTWVVNYLTDKGGYTPNPIDDKIMYGNFNIGPKPKYAINPTKDTRKILYGEFSIGPRRG